MLISSLIVASSGMCFPALLQGWGRDDNSAGRQDFFRVGKIRRPRLATAPWGLNSPSCVRSKLTRRPEDKLEVLQVACSKCDRRGQYPVARLIERYGREAKLVDWKRGGLPAADQSQRGGVGSVW